MSKTIDILIEEALGNIRGDRELAREFLNEIANQIAADPLQNKYLSPVAAKHIETLQRSNEQLVKIIGIQNKNRSQDYAFTDEDKGKLFDMIQEDN